MRFTCEKSALQEACAVTSRAVPAKSPIASIEGILIEALETENKVKITGYDLKRAIFTTLYADIEEPGVMIPNSRFFGEMLRRMPDGIITVSCDDNNNIYVKCGKSEYNFPGLESSEYPEIPVLDKKNSVEIPQKVLKNMICRTLFAVAKEEVRPIYTGTLFEIIGNELTLVSVDGYRLARRSENLESCKLENCSFIVPGFALNDIEKICDESDDTVKITVGEKHISFSIDETVVITRRLEGDFLNHRKSVPESFRYVVNVKKQEIIATVERVSLILSDSNTSPVRILFEDGKLNCQCMSPIGKAQDICLCSGSGDNLEIGFNDKYLLDALKAAEKDELSICINTSSSPCVIKAADKSDNFAYMILPVRLRQN